jgi:hypothetical protein
MAMIEMAAQQRTHLMTQSRLIKDAIMQADDTDEENNFITDAATHIRMKGGDNSSANTDYLKDNSSANTDYLKIYKMNSVTIKTIGYYSEREEMIELPELSYDTAVALQSSYIDFQPEVVTTQKLLQADVNVATRGELAKSDTTGTDASSKRKRSTITNSKKPKKKQSNSKTAVADTYEPDTTTTAATTVTDTTDDSRHTEPHHRDSNDDYDDDDCQEDTTLAEERALAEQKHERMHFEERTCITEKRAVQTVTEH